MHTLQPHMANTCRALSTAVHSQSQQSHIFDWGYRAGPGVGGSSGRQQAVRGGAGGARARAGGRAGVQAAAIAGALARLALYSQSVLLHVAYAVLRCAPVE